MEMIKKIYCPSCHFKNPKGRKVCSQCGVSLKFDQWGERNETPLNKPLRIIAPENELSNDKSPIRIIPKYRQDCSQVSCCEPDQNDNKTLTFNITVNIGEIISITGLKLEPLSQFITDFLSKISDDKEAEND